MLFEMRRTGCVSGSGTLEEGEDPVSCVARVRGYDSIVRRTRSCAQWPKAGSRPLDNDDENQSRPVNQVDGVPVDSPVI